MHLLVFLILTVVVLLVIWESSNQTVIISQWQQSFDHIRLSPEQFYQFVEEAVKQRRMTGISFSRIRQVETHLFSERREYLRIAYGRFVLDVCAAHVGAGSYVSWWLSEKKGLFRVFVSDPKMAEALDVQTYYEADTKRMYKDIIHACILKTIDSMTAGKGVRITDTGHEPTE